jgi:hypothetical protein
MSQPKPALVLLLAASLCACTAASKPLLTPINKGAASTALYTAPLSAGRPLVLDISAPAVTSPCSGTTTTVTLSANSTDGANPLSPVSFAATATCAAAPSGAAGVAGLGRSSASLPAQVASTQKVVNSFALFLPSDGKTGFSGNGVGAAIFGGGPFYLAPPADREAITTLLSSPVPLRQPFAGNPGYFVTASNGIAIDGTRVAVSGALVVGLSTTTPYTQLRSDVYRPFITAFDRALGQSAKVSAVSPFELCYDSSKLGSSLSGYFVPQVDVMLEGGTNFTVVGGNSMAQVNSGTACFAFVQMKAGTGTMPAAVIGGFQMENKLVVLDNGKQQLSFTGYLPARGFSCSNFNFTRAA